MTQQNTGLIGQMLEKFEVLSLVGEGAMGSVYQARDTTLNRIIALKVLHPQYTVKADDVERFRREARNAASLNHPNIVTIYEVGEQDQLYYIAMEYIEGQTLADVMQQEGAMGITRIVELLEPVANALDAAHAQKIIHRDIKPSNIMVSNQGTIYLMDFGIARVLDAAQTSTAAGMVLGTPMYMSPEQARGDTEIGTATDIYALGVVIYQMLTGKFPFEADTTMLTLFARLKEPPRPLRDFLPNIDPGLEQAVMRALEMEPKNRYATAGEFIAALTPYTATSSAHPAPALGNTVVLPRPPANPPAPQASPPVPTSRPATSGSKKGPPILRIIGGLLALLLLGGGLAVFVLDINPLAREASTPVAQTAPAGGSLSESEPTAVPVSPTEATPSGLALSNQIVYVRSDNGATSLAIQSPDATESTPLGDSSGAANPVISPDTSRLAFDMQGDIYTMNADASELTNLTNGEGNNAYPAWSPDGTQIAFVRDRSIYVMNADGSDAVAITDREESYRDLVWASAGDELLAFAVDGDIFVMQADGANLDNLSSRPGSRDEQPAWSPDGTQIAFASDRGADTFNIYVMGASGANPNRLTDNEANDRSPAWSPDGSQIVFHTGRDGNDELYVMNADGSNQTNITNTPNIDETTPVWSAENTD